MKKVDKVIYNLSVEECKILIEKSQKDEWSEWKNTIQYKFCFFLIFINNILKNIR